jgi:hypothetical protein
MKKFSVFTAVSMLLLAVFAPLAAAQVVTPNAPVLISETHNAKETVITYNYMHNLGQQPAEIHFFMGTPNGQNCDNTAEVAVGGPFTADQTAQTVSVPTPAQLPACFVAQTWVIEQELISDNSNILTVYQENAQPDAQAPQVLGSSTTVQPAQPQVKAAQTLADTGNASQAGILLGLSLMLATVVLWQLSRKPRLD